MAQLTNNETDSTTKDLESNDVGAEKQSPGLLRRHQSFSGTTNKTLVEKEELDTLAELESSPGINRKNCINKALLPVRRHLIRTASTSKVQYAMIRLAIIEGNHQDLQALLRRKDSKINEIEGDGMASIHFAAMYGTCESIKILLKEGAIINIPSTKGEYPVDIACKNGNFEIAQLLIEKGARLDHVVDGTPCSDHHEGKRNRIKSRSQTIDTCTM